jgi:uncharacterized hydantoinase/oxoprolinase family protein
VEWGLSPAEILELAPEIVEAMLEHIAKQNQEIENERRLQELRARG